MSDGLRCFDYAQHDISSVCNDIVVNIDSLFYIYISNIFCIIMKLAIEGDEC